MTKLNPFWERKEPVLFSDETIAQRVRELPSVDEELSFFDVTSSEPDPLDFMFFLQKQFEEVFFGNLKKLPPDQQIGITLDLLNCLTNEIEEVRNELPWKHWKRYRKEPNHDLIRKEIIDLVHFLLSLCLIWGIDQNNILEEFLRKHTINRSRLKEQWTTQTPRG